MSLYFQIDSKLILIIKILKSAPYFSQKKFNAVVNVYAQVLVKKHSNTWGVSVSFMAGIKSFNQNASIMLETDWSQTSDLHTC